VNWHGCAASRTDYDIVHGLLGVDLNFLQVRNATERTAIFEARGLLKIVRAQMALVTLPEDSTMMAV